MEVHYEDLIHRAYGAFNSRDIDSALTTMHADVDWPKAFEGGYVSGHDAIREYWSRQWTEINPTVKPVSFDMRADERLAVSVYQNVRDMEGNVLFDGTVKHVYVLQDHLLRRMDIEQE